MRDRGGPERVLVADDASEVRSIARHVLESEGYAVTVAADGREAVDAFGAEPADIVLLDIQMPEMNGLEACERLRRLAPEHTPIVFLTADDSEEAYRAAVDLRADDFLKKPIHGLELVMRVRSLLRISDLNRQLHVNYDVMVTQHRQLQDLERQKAELVELIVHDLKSPLASILASARFAREGTEVGEAREALDDALSSAGDLQRMVLNLLDVSRAEELGLTLTHTYVDVRKLIARVCAAMRWRSAQSGHAIRYAVEGAPRIRGDADVLRRVLDNLVDNALKFSPAGGTVLLGARDTGHSVEITVRDDGPGIPESRRDRIFEKYARLDAALHARTSRGLGLAFCRIAVEAHGGTIDVESGDETGGATFRVVLAPG